MSPRAVLTDIEGTTTSISFVHDVLFPFSKTRLASFVDEYRDDEAVAPLLKDAAVLAEQPEASPTETVEILLSWIAQDRKATPLKALQGLIWDEGYQTGELKGHLYPDAHDYLKRWNEAGVTLAVFSSGSVQAQKLLFGHSEFGDLRPFFQAYFDTTTGPKREKESYEKIALELALSPAEVLFLSDVQEELDAAKEAGMRVCLVDRNAQTPNSVSDFSEIERQFFTFENAVNL